MATRLQAVQSHKMMQRRAYIRRKAGVVERRGPSLCAAAVAHIHANHVATGVPGQRRFPNVLRVR
jgi:hypothetical protein